MIWSDKSSADKIFLVPKCVTDAMNEWLDFVSNNS